MVVKKTQPILLVLLMLCLAISTVIVVTLLLPLVAAQASTQTYSAAGILTLLLLIAVAILTILRWEYGLFLTLASLSLVNRLKTVYFVDFGHVFITAETVFLFLLLIGWFFRNATQHRRERFKHYLVLPVFFFLAAGFLSLVNSADERVSVRLLVAGVVQPIILFYLITNNIRTRRQVKLVIYALIASAVVATMYGLWQSLATIVATGDMFDYRIVSVFYSPAIFAEILLLSIPLVVVTRLSLRNQKRTAGILLDITFGGMIVALLLTLTRAAWLGLFVLLAILLVNKEMRSYLFRWVPVVLMFVLIQSALVAELLTRRSYDLFAFNDSTTSVGERLFAWQTAFVMMEDKPLGIGLGMFRRTWHTYQPNHAGMDAAHNLLLDTGVEMGLLGMIAFIWIAIHALRINLRLYRSSADAYVSRLALGVFSALGGYFGTPLAGGAELAHNDMTIPGIPLGSPISTGMLVFWSLLACLFILGESEKASDELALRTIPRRRYVKHQFSNV